MIDDRKQLVRRLRRVHAERVSLHGDTALGDLIRKAADLLERDAAVLEGLTEGSVLIAAERTRQISGEGWTPEHDDRHEDCELALAAMVYADPRPNASGFDPESPPLWPFEREWYKPRDYRANLIRAGALIAAEIERVGRELVEREKNLALQHAQEQAGRRE